MNAAKGYGGVRGRRAIFTPEQIRARRRDKACAAYRARAIAHRCNVCSKPGHNALTCRDVANDTNVR